MKGFYMGKLNVDGTEIQVLQVEEDDYISLTDMVRKIDNEPALIEKWLRNKNTIEFLGIWEEMYNADFYTAAYAQADCRRSARTLSSSFPNSMGFTM